MHMSVRLVDSYVTPFVGAKEIEYLQPLVSAAHTMLHEKSAQGNKFLGWLDLPRDYDKAEYARIQAAAAKIRKSCDVFIVIGIGGSYLGARAVIEFVKHKDSMSACRTLLSHAPLSVSGVKSAFVPSKASVTPSERSALFSPVEDFTSNLGTDHTSSAAL